MTFLDLNSFYTARRWRRLILDLLAAEWGIDDIAVGYGLSEATVWRILRTGIASPDEQVLVEKAA